MDALGDHTTIAAEIQNLTLAPPALPLPGIPLSIDPTSPPVFIQVIDRDVILARSDVVAVPVEFDCLRPSLDGCNYEAVAPVSVAGIPIECAVAARGTDRHRVRAPVSWRQG